ncbi:hypothetical protein IE53DRAFT_383049 [Violaceomyces palustris]|uniref:Uncharacterized protein n=1 Tax=Violaceomyces palustris TaxID=1673888 RepID=A0ACD0P8E8_9BASI|nr:hypothetical protein IE53DRAFT_383049 [Violaceomyces palustris]
MHQSTPIQSISIPRHESRSSPTPHIVYAVLVSLPVRNWTVYKRYSEFEKLLVDLQEPKPFGAGCPPPERLPPKNPLGRTLKTIRSLGAILGGGVNDEERRKEEMQLRERRDGLEKFLRSIVSSSDDSWRESSCFKDFIGLPSSAVISDPSAGVAAGVGSRLGHTAGSSGGYSRSSNPAGGSGGGSSQRLPPGAYVAPRRTLGNGGGGGTGSHQDANGTARPPAQEDHITRQLDDNGLLSLQEQAMKDQDEQLLGLAAILRRQRQMGLAINQELTEQNELLQQLDDEVGVTQSKMDGAEKKMRRLEGKK